MEGCDMDFSDIRTIIIGEAGEYGKRLVRYLEIHLSSAVRVYHFTTAEGMVSFKEEAEIYLLDERFFKELSEEKQKFLKQKKLILLTWREEQGSFCKYDNPQKLLDMLSDFTDYNSDLSDLAAELKDTPTKLTIVYSPVYEKGFQNLLQSMMTSLQAGYSLNNSCRIALKELEELYQDQNNPMLRQMRRIIQGLDLHITLEQLFMEFAESTGLEEAKQFAVVIEIVRSTGGNMVEILKRTMQHLKYKMDTEEEIRVLLSGKLFEKNIMLSMPFFILLYLRLANPKYVECFYNTILGHLVMSGMIGITVFCFFWSEKIMNIRF